MENNIVNNEDSINEDRLREELSSAQEEYDNWSMDINRAKEYGLTMGDINIQNSKDIDKMRALVGNNNHKLISILDEKASLLDKIAKDNMDYLDRLDYEYSSNNKKYQDKIQGLHDEIIHYNSNNNAE